MENQRAGWRGWLARHRFLEGHEGQAVGRQTRQKNAGKFRLCAVRDYQSMTR